MWSGIGWSHLVVLMDRCTGDVRCSVSTNVDPKPIEVTVRTNETVQVITAESSQAQAFVPQVTCDYLQTSR